MISLNIPQHLYRIIRCRALQHSASYLPCDICGSSNPRFVLDSRSLDGPLVECVRCGFRYVGSRRSALTFGTHAGEETAANVRAANQAFRDLRLQEEHRLASLNAAWRLDLVRKLKPSGRLLEIGCARGDFLRAAREFFDASGVEPNPELAESASRVAPVYRDVIERTPWNDFDVVASFHVIEHVHSPRSFIHAAAARLKPGGLLAIETPNIDSLPFKVFKSSWRQFIPEHGKIQHPVNLKEQRGIRPGRDVSDDHPDAQAECDKHLKSFDADRRPLER